MKILRWIAVFLVLLLLVSSLWAQEPADLLRSFSRNFAIASLDVKMQIIQDAGNSGYSGLGPLYRQAIDYVMDNFSLVDTDPRFRQLAVLAVDQLESAGFTEGKYSVWKLFDTDEDTGVRISCLNALATLAQGDEEIIGYVNMWLQRQNAVFQSGRIPDVYVVSAAVRALGELRDQSSFPVLFTTMTVGYTDNIVRSARENLFRLEGELKDSMIGILKESDLAEKKLALEISLATDRLSEKDKGEIAQFAMDVGLHTAAVDNPSRQIARDIRYIAAVALGQRKWASAADLAVEHFDAVLSEYDRGVTDKRRVVEAIDCLGALGTHEAAVRLTQYLVLLNSYTERLKEFDNTIVLAVIENLGSLGDKSAFDDLLYAQYLSYSSEVKKAARDALENLKW
jgi:HEAT repeat protein